MLLDRILGRRTESLGGTLGPWRISEAPGNVLVPNNRAAGVDVNQDSAMSLSAVFAGVSKLSSIIAALPLSVYRKDGTKRVVAENHPAQWLLHTEYNRAMSAFIGRRTAEFHRLLWGNSYTEIVWDGASRPGALIPIEPWRVSIETDWRTESMY